MSPREFGEAWALSQLSPGIHLVALAGLIGRRVAGWRGVAAAVAGMMIPAAAITVALTAAYGLVAESPLALAALAGLAPATGGMTIATAALLVKRRAQGRMHFATDGAYARRVADGVSSGADARRDRVPRRCAARTRRERPIAENSGLTSGPLASLLCF